MELGMPRNPSLPQQFAPTCQPLKWRRSPERNLMTITRTIGLALATASAVALVVTAAPNSAAANDAVSGSPKNVSRWVAGAQKVGSAAESQQVHFSMFLGFKNQDQLKKLIEAQYKPGSA